MIIAVNDKTNEVFLCGLDAAQVFALTGALKAARKSGNAWYRAVSLDMHLSCRWILSGHGTISLCHLNWEQVFTLRMIAIEYILRWPRSTEAAKLRHLVEGFDAAVEIDLRGPAHV